MYPMLSICLVNLTLMTANSSLVEYPSINATSSLFEFSPMPTRRHIDDPFATILDGAIGSLYMLAFMWPLVKILKGMVEEKETRMKEGMKVHMYTPVTLILYIRH
jgi:hypothetical protein